MKAFGFLSASSAEIGQIDHKLLLFQEIFQGTYRVATHAKDSLGSFGTSFKGIADTLSSIYRDPVYSQVTDQSEVLKVSQDFIRISEAYGILDQKLDLSKLSTLIDSFEMRRMTIQSNCEAMTGKLEEDYKNYESFNLRYTRECGMLRDSFGTLQELSQNPKTYFDLNYTGKLLGELRSKVNSVVELETKVYALVTLFNNSIKDLVQNTLQSKPIILELLQVSSDTFKEFGTEYQTRSAEFQATQTISPESVERLRDRTNFFGNLITALHLPREFVEELAKNSSDVLNTHKVEVIQSDNHSDDEDETPDHPSIGNSTSKLFNDLDQLILKLDVEVDDMKVLQVSSFFLGFVEACLQKYHDFEASTMLLVNRCLHSVELLQEIESKHASLKVELHMATDNDGYFKSLYANYNTEMNFVIKNYFIFFDIIQKAIKKLFKTIELEHTDLKQNFHTNLDSLQARIMDLKALHKSAETALVGSREAYSEAGSNLAMVAHAKHLHKKLRICVKELEGDFRGFFIKLYHSTPLFFDGALGFLSKVVKGLDKMCKELTEHSDIELSFLSAIDTSEASMMETLKMDHKIKPLLGKTLEITSQNQLVFAGDTSIHQYISGLRRAANEWLKDLGSYLKNDSQLKTAVVQGSLPAQTNPQAQLKQGLALQNLPADFESYLDLTEEDVTLALAHQYEARMNRKNIPLNGTLYLLGDYMVFYTQSMAGNAFIVLPYDSVKDLKAKKNFLGLNNGLAVETTKGQLEFFLSGNSKRDEFVSKCSMLIQTHRLSEASAIRKEVSLRNWCVLWMPDASQEANTQPRNPSVVTIPEELSDQSKLRVHQSLKKLRIGMYNSDSITYVKRIQEADLQDMVQLWFGVTPYMYEGKPTTNFLYHWRESTGCKNIELCSVDQLPQRVTSSDPSLNSFYSGPLSLVLITVFESPDRLKLRERISITFTHPDEVAIVIQVKSMAQVEYETLMLVRQGCAVSAATGTPGEQPFQSPKEMQQVIIKKWRRRDLPNIGQSAGASASRQNSVKDLYSEKFVEFMAQVAEERHRYNMNRTSSAAGGMEAAQTKSPADLGIKYSPMG